MIFKICGTSGTPEQTTPNAVISVPDFCGVPEQKAL
jgi:hypothetical protein